MCPYKFYFSSLSALGIGAASFASGIWERDLGAGAGAGTGFGSGCGWGGSEQRYSGKPDGAAGTPKFKSENLKT